MKKKTAVPAPTPARTLETYAFWALLACVGAVPLAVAASPFGGSPLAFDAFVYPQNLVLFVCVCAALALWGAAVLTGRAVLRWSRPLWALAAFGVWAAVATVAALEPVRSLLGTSKSALSLANILAYLAVAFLVTQLASTGGRMRQLTWTVAGSGAAVAAVALLQQLFRVELFGLTTVAGYMSDRGFSTIGNPDHLGTFLVLPAVLCASLLLSEPDRGWRVAGGGLALILTALVATLTRGAWVAAAVGLLVALAPYARRIREREVLTRAGVLAGIVVLAIALAVVSSDEGRLIERFQPARQAQGGAPTTAATVNAVSSGRLDLARSALGIAARRPLTGTGPGAFELGWYGSAVNPGSAGGGGTYVEDPHSFALYVLATTGVPGVLAYLVAVVWALVLGARTAFKLLREGAGSAKARDYVAWFAAACALQAGLLFGAVTTPIVVCLFAGLAVLMLPASSETARGSALPRAAAGAAAVTGLALVAGAYPTLAAEVRLAPAVRGALSMQAAADAARTAPWNMDVQRAYVGLAVSQAAGELKVDPSSARADVTALADALARDGAGQPAEYYYPAIRAQLLRQAAERLGDASLAEEAVKAADQALSLMPGSIPTRVVKALALSQLQRYGEMAKTLAGYWRKETSSSYPGILYAQALALSGDKSGADRTFAELATAFPGDEAVTQARTQAAQTK